LNQTIPTDILVIDNASTDETEQSIVHDGYTSHANLLYRRLETNSGGAGGFYEGTKDAFEQGYDFIWLMDDDAEPEIDALEFLLQSAKNHPEHAAYATAVYIGDKENNSLSTYGHRGVFDYNNPLPAFQKPIRSQCHKQEGCEIEMASFVGILIPAHSVELVGLPRKEFFIHHDDTEYSLRLAKIGTIWMDNRAKIYHKEKRQEEKILKHFLWFSKQRIRFDKLWLKYFGLRNSIHIARQYSTNRTILLRIFALYLNLIRDIILYDDHKWIRILFATHSVFDGVSGVFDNTKAQRILSKASNV
jgi:GT2 family glycosyltransferase